MTTIEKLKAAVSPADAAGRYGLEANRRRSICPFHDDHHPSMQLYADHFHCFACGAHGDVIDLTAKLLGVPVKDAVHRLETDFGISPNDPPKTDVCPKPRLSVFRKKERLCLSTLTQYEALLRKWKTEHSPRTPESQIDDRYQEACQMLDYVEYLADFLCTSGLEDRVRTVENLMENGLVLRLHQKRKEVNPGGSAA